MGIDLNVKIVEKVKKDSEKTIESWQAFFESSKVEPLTSDEIAVLLAVECQGRKRLYFAQRLLGMYHTALRVENARAMATALSKK